MNFLFEHSFIQVLFNHKHYLSGVMRLRIELNRSRDLVDWLGDGMMESNEFGGEST